MEPSSYSQQKTDNRKIPEFLIDKPTGLFNHQGFLVLANQQLKVADRTRKWLSLFMVKINNLDLTKDKHSDKSDQLLLEAADILGKTFRSSDIIAHIEGDTLTVLALDAHYSSSHIIRQRLEQNLEIFAKSQEQQPRALSLNIGISFYDPDHPCSIDDLISRAKKSLSA